jgi:hypothetical protein
MFVTRNINVMAAKRGKITSRRNRDPNKFDLSCGAFGREPEGKDPAGVASSFEALGTLV